MKKGIYESVEVKPTYIHVPLNARVIYSGIIFFLVWVLSFVSLAYLNIEYQDQLLATIALPVSLIIALPPSIVAFSLEWILKRLCKSWKYPRFLFLQMFSRMLLAGIVVFFAGIFVLNFLYGPFPLWSSILLLSLLLLMLFSGLMVDFFNYAGEGVLFLETFMQEFESAPNEADFRKLLLGAQRISKIARYYNMQIPPYSLSLGMTISLLENGERTHRSIRELVEWLENPTEQENFKRFRKLVEEFSFVAELSSESGIKEKHHWSAENAIAVASAIVIPIAVAIIAYVVPRLLEMYLSIG